MQTINFFDWRGKEINCCLLLEDTYILGRKCELNVNSWWKNDKIVLR